MERQSGKSKRLEFESYPYQLLCDVAHILNSFQGRVLTTTKPVGVCWGAIKRNRLKTETQEPASRTPALRAVRSHHGWLRSHDHMTPGLAGHHLAGGSPSSGPFCSGVLAAAPGRVGAASSLAGGAMQSPPRFQRHGCGPGRGVGWGRGAARRARGDTRALGPRSSAGLQASGIGNGKQGSDSSLCGLFLLPF